MVKSIEFVSMVILGILLVLAFTHFLNGTFSSWVSSKFTTHDKNDLGSATGAAVSGTVGGGIGKAAANKIKEG